MADTAPDADMIKAFNQQIIEEFRANDGVVGGPFEGATVVLLTTTGARSGLERTSPLVANTVDGQLYVIASAGGSQTHPAWFHNIQAEPNVVVEMGRERFDATARVAPEPQRTALFDAMATLMPQFSDYQMDNPRTIPVVLLDQG